MSQRSERPSGSAHADEDQVGCAQDPSQPWPELAADYERARARQDSLDRLVEWPAERGVPGDVTGCSIITHPPAGVELIRGDLSYPDMLPELSGRTFDRILFLQSFGYVKDPVQTCGLREQC